MTAQLLAVRNALFWHLRNPPDITTQRKRYTDSQVAVSVLQAPLKEPISTIIAETSRQLRRPQGVYTHVVLVPSHSGVLGNEATHATASKILASDRCSDVATFMSHDGNTVNSCFEQ